MSLETNDKKQYGAPDFERYYSGKMSVQEMHALEKAALEDPFLADALEGYKHTPTPAADLAWLKSQLEAKAQKSKVVPITPKKSYPFLRIAALVLLLAGAGWSVYLLMEGKKDTLALDAPQEKAATVQTTTTPATAPDTATKEVPVRESVTTEAPFTTTLPRKSTAKKVTVQAATPATGMAASSVADGAVADSSTPMLLRAEAAQEVAAAQNKAAAPTITLRGRSNAAPNSFRGRVVDESNQGVPNASVSVRNSRTAVATDEEGYFTLNANDTAVKAVVGAVGYETQDITLSRQKAEANIVLKEVSGSLSEVVVVRRGVRQNADAISLPQPVDGWDQYHTYLQKNRTPSGALDQEGIKGSVTLSFDINRKGEPENIKVDSSLSPRHDQEAVRLLQEGPKWKRKKDARGKVTINF